MPDFYEPNAYMVTLWVIPHPDSKLINEDYIHDAAMEAESVFEGASVIVGEIECYCCVSESRNGSMDSVEIEECTSA